MLMTQPGNLANKTPPLDSVWECPCGYTNSYQSVCAHRKGWRKREGCRGTGPNGPGRIWMVHPGSSETGTQWMPESSLAEAHEAPAAPPIEPEAEPLPEAGDEEIPSDVFAPFEYTGEDPEALAAALLRDRPSFDAPSPNGNGHGPVDTVSLDEGEWSEEKSSGPPAISEFREAVTLPAVARVIYDWARAQRWHQGDGSLSAFVTDVLLDHFRECWGMKIVVVSREEVEVADRA